jgi:hypothetical protein
MAHTAAKNLECQPRAFAARNRAEVRAPWAALAALGLFATLAAAVARDVPAAERGDAARLGSLDRFEPPLASRAWKSIVLHHSATSGGNVESIDAAHRRNRDRSGNPWLGIGYHFVVGNGQKMADGEIQSTFRWQKQLPGAHAGVREYNELGIGICLIGNFDEMAPTDRQLAALGELLKSLAGRYAIPRERLVRHQEIQATLCPGRLFPWEQVRGAVSPTSGS